MRNFRRFKLSTELLGLTPLALLLLSSASSLAQDSTEEVVQRSMPAVVLVVAHTDDGIIQGSGFIVDEGGIIITNHHVIDGATSAAVKLANGDVFDRVTVVVTDERRDLAILKIGGFGLPTVPLGNSDSVAVGSEIVAIGSPLGLENTVSTGIVSGRRQTAGYTLLQISAPISSGSSGGPILSDGVVIAVAVSRIPDGQNLNFAVPINYARGLLAVAGTATGSQLQPMGYELETAEDEPAEDELQPVNTDWTIDLEGFASYTIEYETDLGDGYKERATLTYKVVPGRDGSTAVERYVESETTYKENWLDDKVTVGRARYRSTAAAEDLAPIASYYFSQDWDGKQWNETEIELRYDEGRVQGVSTSETRRKEVDRRLPTGMVDGAFLGFAQQWLAADSLEGHSVVMESYNPFSDEVETTRLEFESYDKKMKEGGREFLKVLRVTSTQRTDVRTAYVSADAPRVIIKAEGPGWKMKLKKIR